jgi:hypothetical protein
MNRDQFKLLAAGQYSEKQALSSGLIDRKEMAMFVDGALFGWDMASKEVRQQFTFNPGVELNKSVRIEHVSPTQRDN